MAHKEVRRIRVPIWVAPWINSGMLTDGNIIRAWVINLQRL